MPNFEVGSLCLQGSDIETLGSEAAVEYAAALLERPPVEEEELLGTDASASAGTRHITDTFKTVLITLCQLLLFAGFLSFLRL